MNNEPDDTALGVFFLVVGVLWYVLSFFAGLGPALAIPAGFLLVPLWPVFGLMILFGQGK